MDVQVSFLNYKIPESSISCALIQRFNLLSDNIGRVKRSHAWIGGDTGLTNQATSHVPPPRALKSIPWKARDHPWYCDISMCLSVSQSPLQVFELWVSNWVNAVLEKRSYSSHYIILFAIKSAYAILRLQGFFKTMKSATFD